MARPKDKDGKTPLLPILGVILGATLAIVPFIVTMVGLSRASNVEGGFRGATHVEDMDGQVTFALGSASASALLVPPGLLLMVMSGLTLAGRRRRGEQQQGPSDEREASVSGGGG